MANQGYRVIFTSGSYTIKRQGFNQPGLDLERALIDFAIAKGLAVNQSGDCCTISNKFRTTQDVGGNTTITHNLNLNAPYATIVDVRNAGVSVPFTLVSETANTVVINSAAVVGATITII